ncbi:MAG: 3-oxoacyl-ACP reductase family protein [Polyangiales bacterium]
MFELTGKTALVTGASRGIGRAIAVSLARQGAWVAVNYARSAEAAEETLSQVREAGSDGELLPFDVADGAATASAIEDLAKRRAGLSVVVSNAGINADNLVLRLDDDEFERILATNVKGALHVLRAAVRPMMRARWGRMIAVSSVVGEMGNAGQVAYATSKSALFGMMKSLAKEYGSRGVTANVVAPGFVVTDMTAGLSEEIRKRLIELTPAGRLGTPEDVASAVSWLASPEAAWVTGQVVSVNGGLRM